MSQDPTTENQGAIAPVDVLVSVGGRMVVVRAGQYLPSAAQAAAPAPEPPGQEGTAQTDPLPEPAEIAGLARNDAPAPKKPSASPLAPTPSPKSKGAKK